MGRGPDGHREVPPVVAKRGREGVGVLGVAPVQCAVDDPRQLLTLQLRAEERAGDGGERLDIAGHRDAHRSTPSTIENSAAACAGEIAIAGAPMLSSSLLARSTAVSPSAGGANSHTPRSRASCS